jgi:hypothetical protein
MCSSAEIPMDVELLKLPLLHKRCCGLDTADLLAID